MGTRNLTAVFMDGEYKVAQYGQWDGYPSGQGVDILNILKNAKKDILKRNSIAYYFAALALIMYVIEICVRRILKVQWRKRS